MEHSGKNNWIGVIIIVVIVLGAFFFVSRNKPIQMPTTVVPLAKPMNQQPLFTEGLQAVNIKADQIGYHGFSPNGAFFYFTTFTRGGSPANAAYLLKLSDGTVAPLPGSPDRVIEDNRVVQMTGTKGLTLYFTDTGQTKTYDVGGAYGYGSLSPDSKTYAINTPQGIKKIDIASGTVTSFSKSQNDGAYAWYQDSNRILGFKDAGGATTTPVATARTLGTWNMTSGDFSPLATSIPDKTIRMVQWVVPNVVARVTTGSGDKSHDYLVNVDTTQTIDIGDTSGAQMGGVAIDTSRGLFAVVGGDDQSTIGSTVMLYRGMELDHHLTLPHGYFRQRTQIVDSNRLIYIRTQQGATGTTAQQLVLLDLTAGTETVLKDLPVKDLVSLSLAPDHQTWILSDNANFILGTL